MEKKNQTTIMICDSDEEVLRSYKDAFLTCSPSIRLKLIKDFESLFDYLSQCNISSDCECPSLPGLILLNLDIAMANKFKALRRIKSDPRFRVIPVLIMAGSKSDEEVFYSYDSGANSFIVCPMVYGDLAEVAEIIAQYWLKVAQIPRSYQEP